MRVGALGKASAITQDPHSTIANDSDYLILSLVYDALTVPGAEQATAPRLMSRWEADASQRRWTFTIAEGASFHDGSPVTSADVVWSLQRLRGQSSGATKVPVEPNAITAAGDRAVVLDSTEPNSALPLLLRLVTFTMKKDTTEIAGAPGSGPFRLESYSGGNARLVANPAWHGGAPLLEAIEVTMFESPQAMSNAVLAGQIDLASNVGPVAARTAEGRGELAVVRRPNDTSMPVVMRTSDGPFADPRVREAMRLVADRDALVRQALSGYGSVANDVMGTADPDYDRSLPQRPRDVARASALLDQAGFDRSQRIPFHTTEEIFGLADSATLFANQAQEIGVNLEVIRQDPTVFYDSIWLTAPIYTMYWGTNDSVVFFAQKTLNSAATWNETAFHDPEFDAAYARSVSSSDPAAAVAAVTAMQRIQHERGGYLLWGMADGVDVASTRVQGLPVLPGYGRVQLEKAWLSA
ncbi:ABC transporter substrate-binding protein [Pseudonocardia sp. DLS-67]